MITLSHGIVGGDFDSAGMATRKLKEQLARIGVGALALRRAMIAAYEAEMNVVIHARAGTLWARLDGGKLDLEIADEGPGIPDVELALREGWSTASEKARQMGFGAGMGLPNIRRNSDLFEIDTRIGKGTRIRSTILLTPEAAGAEAAGSGASVSGSGALALDQTLCRGCRRCIFACPTAALRVRGRSPALRSELCIGCAACMEACPDDVFGIPDKGEVLGPVPADSILVLPRGFLFGFPGSLEPERILGALRGLGFTEVRFLDDWEDALRAEARREAERRDLPLPRIPPFCGPLVSLIESRFASLIPHLSPFLSPSEAVCGEFPMRPVTIAAACPGQYAACAGSSLTERLTVVSPRRLAQAVLSRLRPRGEQSVTGVFPAVTGPVHIPGELAVSGANAVLRALSQVEMAALRGISLLELHLCAGGCTASPLLTPDPQLAPRLWNMPGAATGGTAAPRAAAEAARRSRPYAQRKGVRLDDDMAEAIRKLGLIDRRSRSLPGRDCGSCGAPSCAAFAEDVVLGRADSSDCPYVETTE
ncbi:MAG TPA: (Fe-S)-binding protein [Spirochaetia bacterium]|nr:(Fe-S)-binding protein [Spirochaetia bacterium]